MNFRVIPRQKPYCTAGDFQNFIRLLFKGQILDGPFIEKFEKKFAEYCSARWALATNSCRTGFYLLFRAFNITQGDEVILPAYNMSIFPKILQLHGIKPVFVDIEAETLNMNVKKLESCITSRTKAIVAVHLFGNPCNIDLIMHVAKKHNLIVIEDCANTIAADYQGKMVGSFGDAAVFSLGHSKDVPTFGGGMLVTNNGSLYKKMRQIYNKEFTAPSKYRIIKMFLKNIFLKFLTCKIFFLIFLYPIVALAEFMNSDILNDVFEEKDDVLNSVSRKKYTNFQALIGIEHLDKIQSMQSRRIANARVYDKILSRVNTINLPKVLEGAQHVYWAYPIWVENRSKVMKGLMKHGIDAKKIYTYDCNNYAIFTEFKADCPVSEQASEKILGLPVYHFLKEKDIKFIAETLVNVLKNDQSRE